MKIFYLLLFSFMMSAIYGSQSYWYDDFDDDYDQNYEIINNVVIDENNTVIDEADLFLDPSPSPVFDESCVSNLRQLIWIPFLEYVGGDGLSYSDGYETAGSFFALFNDSRVSYPFAEIELHRIEEGKLAANLGLGWRMLVSDRNELFGANVFFDVRHTKQIDFYQFGLGAEFLGSVWDFRINGYIPISSRKALIESTRFDFSGDLFEVRNTYRIAMWGVDTEVGGWLYNCGCLNIYGAAGPYFYHSRCCNTLIGGMGRLAIQFTPYITFEFQITHDSFFDTNVQGQVRFSLQFPCLIDCLKCLFVRIHRNPIIVLEDVCLWDANF